MSVLNGHGNAGAGPVPEADGSPGTTATSGEAKPEVCRRTLMINITGSAATFDSLGTCSWSLTPEQAALVFASTGADSSGLTPDEVQWQLRNAIPTKVTVLGSNNNLEDVGCLRINGLAASEFTQTGEGMHYLLLGPGRTSEPCVVYEARGDLALHNNWQKQFPNFTRENIATQGAMQLQGADYHFVHENHPATQLLYNNQDALAMTMDEADKVNNHWYRVNNSVFTDACYTLEKEIFDKMPAKHNFAEFEVSLVRPGNKRWLDVPSMNPALTSASMDQETRRTEYRKYAEKQLFVTARLAVEYMLPEVPRRSDESSVTMPNQAALPAATAAMYAASPGVGGAGAMMHTLAAPPGMGVGMMGFAAQPGAPGVPPPGVAGQLLPPRPS